MRVIIPLAVAAVILALSVTAPAQEPPPPVQPGDGLPEDQEALRKIIAEQKETIDRLIKELNDTKDAIEKLKRETVAKAEAPKEAATVPKDALVGKEKPVEGEITKVRMETKQVLVDIGSEEGLQSGDILDVSRAGRKIGRVKIGEAVYENWCNAEIAQADVDFIPGDKVVRISSALKKTPLVEASEPVKQLLREEKTASVEPAGAPDRDIGRRLDTLEGLFADLAKQLQRIEDRLEKKEDAAAEETVRESAPKAVPERVEPPAGFKTTIADVTKTYVILSAGTDNGLKEGDTFLIKRGDREIARVKVIKLGKDICRADIISKNEDIQKMRDEALLE